MKRTMRTLLSQGCGARVRNRYFNTEGIILCEGPLPGTIQVLYDGQASPKPEIRSEVAVIEPSPRPAEVRREQLELLELEDGD